MPEREHTDLLKKLPMSAEDIRDIPLSYAKAVRTELQALPTEARTRAFAAIQAWVRFAREKGIEDTSDPFIVQYYLQEFAKSYFGESQEFSLYRVVSLSSLGEKQAILSEHLSRKVDVSILRDPNVSLRGGVARLALKLYAGVPVESELPLSDVDIITTDAQSATRYGVDLAGAQIVHGDLVECTLRAIPSVDCTVNQVALVGEQLVFTQEAFEDVQTGTIRILAKNDPLFGTEGMRYPNGEVYLNRTGFYRALSLLLRGKGDRILVSKENIEREIPTLGRYWLTLLFVKILRVGDLNKRDDAVRNWFAIAKELGATESKTPESFLKELLAAFPEMAERIEPTSFTPDKQLRWIVGKFSGSVYSRITQNIESTDLPDTYTPTYIELPLHAETISLDAFWDSINALKPHT